jgi:methylmalonyl-CoA mutase
MSSEPTLQLGEAADEADWRTLVEQGLKGAQWQRLVGKTADGLDIQPLYREPDVHTATDISGMPGAAPFIRGARKGGWMIRQAYEHPDAEETNCEILADLEGGVGAIELVLHASFGDRGLALRKAGDLDRALADVVLEAAPVSLDGPVGLWPAELLEAKLKGVAAPGAAFNLDPIGMLMRTGAMARDDVADAARFAARVRQELPNATVLRADARPVHEAGGTEAQEIAAAIAAGLQYLRALTTSGVGAGEAAGALAFAVAVGPDVLLETAKLRALRLCWARVLEACGAEPERRAARIHAFTSRRMMTRYDAWTNILRVTTAAFAAAVGGADVLTTRPFTDALGLPTPFARRVARNTQHVLMEECRLDHVADPAGGAWFVERLTRELAEKAWSSMQQIEAKGGLIATLQDETLLTWVKAARAERERSIALRRETITGVTDFPLLGAAAPEAPPYVPDRSSLFEGPAHAIDTYVEPLAPMRWAAPFESLRDRAEAIRPRPSVFFATLGRLAAFGPRAQFARNLFAAGGVGALGEEDEYADRDAMIDAFGATHARVAVIVGDDGAYRDEAENAAQRLKAAGAHWVVLAGKPGDGEAALRGAGVDQFVFAGQDALKELETLHAALGIGA